MLACKEVIERFSSFGKLLTRFWEFSKFEIISTPKILPDRESRGSSKINSLDNIIVLGNSFHPAPEIELFIMILMSKFNSIRLDIDPLFNGKCSSDSIHKL